MLRNFFICFGILVTMSVRAQVRPDKNHWVDSVFSELNTEQKIGQLFMVTIPPNATPDAIDAIGGEVKRHEIGGVIFQKETPYHQAFITKSLQQLATIPLFVGQEAGWGVGQSVDSTVSFPRPLLLGAIKDDSLLYFMGKETAREMKILGVNLNFGPLADVNSDPRDPLVSYLSFGENKVNVGAKASAYVRGLQDNGVLSCAKNFTAKGLTIVDIQEDFPSIEVSLDSVKSYPYKKLFENNITGIMPASATVPLTYGNSKLSRKNPFDAATLSLLFTGKWLKEKLNFRGLSFVDIKDVKNDTEKDKSSGPEVIAFQAGNDILINPSEVGPAIRKLKKLIKSEKQYEDQLDFTVKKILAAKYDAGLNKRKDVNLDNLVARLNTPEARVLNQKLHQHAVTVLRDENKILPLTSLDNRHYAYITSDATAPNREFYNYLIKYVNAGYFTVNDKTDMTGLSAALANQQVIVVGIFPETSQAVIDRLVTQLNQLSPAREVIYCDFGHQNFLRTASNLSTVITAYVNTSEALKAVPQVIFGGLKASGKLPFSASTQLREGTGIETNAIQRFAYSIPEDVRMSSSVLSKIDGIATEAIITGATPGCQILVARNGKVIYEKNFGSLRYDNASPVSFETVYDLASLTKVSATLQAVMFMYEKGLIDLNKKVSYYLPDLKKTNKKDITILEMLTHQAGLAPFIPMWTETVKDSVFLPTYYSRTKSEQYPLQVSPNLFAAPAIRDSVWSWIGKSKLIEKAARTPFAYRYSDLGFLILQRLAEKMLNQPLDEFLAQNLYEPLGAYTTGFTPLSRFPVQLIAPTENDKIYRKTMVVGTVHDERAAMMGGIAGHAGLFSNANDLAKLGEMLLQEGQYGGYRYYKPETVRLFTNKQFDKSRRGLGWDKPVQSDWNGPTSLKASPKTFGHTGFTGTCMWVDPEFNLVYVFLSNRVYPDRSNKLNSANIRSRIQDVIYESIFNYCNESPEDKTLPASTVLSSLR